MVNNLLKCRRPGFDPWVGSIPLEKEMATHSHVLAWRIPGTGEPGGLLSMGLHRVRHNWSDLAVTEHTVTHSREISPTFSSLSLTSWNPSIPGKLGQLVTYSLPAFPTPSLTCHPQAVGRGFPGGSGGKKSTCDAGDLGLIPGLGRFPWRRERLLTPVFWPGEFHGL